MLSAIDNFYLEKEEPVKSCLLALKEIILSQHKNMTTAWKYKLPFFCFHGKMFCYLWVQKKSKLPYIGFVDGQKIKHPQLMNEKRARMAIMLIDPTIDLPLSVIEEVIQEAIRLRK